MDLSRQSKVSSKADAKAQEGPKADGDLVDQVLALTGLPGEEVARLKEEIKEAAQNTGVAHENLTLEQLRTAMLAYLESIQNEHLSNSSSS